MADVSAYIAFNVRVVNNVDNPYLQLTDTGSYPSPANTARQGFFTITTPDNITRAYNVNTPDTTQDNLTYNYPLPLATDGKVQLGDYKITFLLKVSAMTDTPLTHNFTLSLKDITPVVAEQFDNRVPALTYADNTNYTQAGFNAPSVSRAWTGSSSPTGSFTGSAGTFDLAPNDLYYDSIYTVGLTSTATYQHSTLPWLSVVTDYTVSGIANTSRPFPPKSEVVGWVTNYDSTASCGCNDDCGYAAAAGRLAHIIARFCIGDTANPHLDIAKLYRLTHKNKAYTATYTNLPLSANDSWGNCSGSNSGNVLRITSQPANQTALSGQDVTFSVVVTGGTAPYQYQLQKEINNVWTAVAGATSSTDVISAVASNDAGSYRFVITDDASGSVVSSVATLTINPSVVITAGYSSSNPFIDDTTAPTISNSFTTLVQDQADIAIRFPSAAIDKFLVIKIPVSQPLPASYDNPPAAAGTPGDGVVRPVLSIGGFWYVVTQDPAGFPVNPNADFTISH